MDNNQSPYNEILDDAVNRVKFTANNLELTYDNEDSNIEESDIMDIEFPEDIADFMTLMRKVEDVIAAGRKIKERMTIELGERYEGRAIKINEKVIVGRPSTTYKPYDKEKILDYLGEDWRAVVRPEFRLTGIKAVATKRGEDPNTIVESLFYKEVTNNNVTILPESKAPKYLQALEDREEKDLYDKNK